jgi:hypothetical protein
MSVSGKIYDINLDFYREMREFHHRFETPYSWMVKTKEMVYYTHWANTVMFEFLNSNDDISTIVKNLKIKTIKEYFETKSLF